VRSQLIGNGWYNARYGSFWSLRGGSARWRTAEAGSQDQASETAIPDLANDTLVDFEQGLHSAIKRLREAVGDSAGNPRFNGSVPGRGYRLIGTVGGGPERIESLAVLPLENLSHDSEQDYLADGLTEALITSLAKINALRVVSRTSVMRYKGVHDKSLREIASELGVDGIAELPVVPAQ
jgi:hypothetical protein